MDPNSTATQPPPKLTWEKPRVEDISLEPSQDVLGFCQTSAFTNPSSVACKAAPCYSP